MTLRELLLHNNYLRALPLEMGKLFKLQILGLKGNPLSTDIMTLFSEVNGTDKILSYLLDNLPSKSQFSFISIRMCFGTVHVGASDSSLPA